MFCSHTLSPHIFKCLGLIYCTSDIFGRFFGVRQWDTSIHFLLQHQMSGEIRSISAKTSTSAPEQPLTLPDISDEEGRTEKIHTSCLDYTHTHTRAHVHSRQTRHRKHTHTWETYLVETGQMFYLSMYVSELSAHSDGGVLISGAPGSARRPRAAVTGTALINYTALTMGGSGL